MRQQPERKASNGKYAKSKKNHDESAGLSDHFPVYDDDSIITRYFFNRPSTVSEELLTYSFTWMSLLASAYVFGKRDHMRMGFMADKLTGNFRKYLEIIIDLLSFSFAAVVMVYGGCSITKLTMIQTTASLRVPMGYIYVMVPVSGILITIFAAMNAVEMFHHEFKEAGEVRA